MKAEEGIFIIISSLGVALYLAVLNLIIGGGLFDQLGGTLGFVVTCVGSGSLIGEWLYRRFK